MIKLVAFLGNYGREYEKTRHNCGFEALDVLADRCRIRVTQGRFHALCGTGVIDGVSVLLMKPQTFMNLSGESLAPILGFYKIPVGDLVVVLDEVNLAPGRIRVRPSGSAGGHNGLKSVAQHLGTQAFARVRIGVGMGHHPVADLAARVLGRIEPEDEAAVEAAVGTPT